jgi:hypothetical protein
VIRGPPGHMGRGTLDPLPNLLIQVRVGRRACRPVRSRIESPLSCRSRVWPTPALTKSSDRRLAAHRRRPNSTQAAQTTSPAEAAPSSARELPGRTRTSTSVDVHRDINLNRGLIDVHGPAPASTATTSSPPQSAAAAMGPRGSTLDVPGVVELSVTAPRHQVRCCPSRATTYERTRSEQPWW